MRQKGLLLRKDEVYGKLLDISKATYFKQIKKDIPIYQLLDTFSLEELDKFVKTKELKSLQHFKAWKNSHKTKLDISRKLHNLFTGKNGEFIKNEKLISFICRLFISFKQMRNDGLIPVDFEQVVWSPEEVTFKELYSLILLTDNQGNLFEDLSENHTAKHIFEDLNNLLSITEDESHHLAYMMEEHLISLVEWGINNESIYIYQAKGLVILSLIIMAADLNQDLTIKQIINFALPEKTIENINKTSSMSKLLRIYHEQITDLVQNNNDI